MIDSINAKALKIISEQDYCKESCLFQIGQINYFSLRFLKELFSKVKINRPLEDFQLVPILVCDYGILELYDYNLSIITKEKIDERENVILRITGKKNIKDVNLEAINLLNHTYFELLVNEVDKFLSFIEHYFDFMEKEEKELITCKLLKNNGRFYYRIT